MMKNLRICLVIIFLSSCAALSPTTKPNKSYLYQIPSLKNHLPKIESEKGKGTQQITTTEKEATFLFEELYKRNPKLAIELGKIPEFQDVVSTEEAEALRNILVLYDIDPGIFNKAFHKMYEVGKPEVRKFCSPLQALFWLAEEDKFSRGNNPLAGYKLELFLMSIWSGFPKKRWKSFNEVTDRLNAPELIDYYERCQISYSRGHRYDMSPRDVFALKTGHCISITAFTVYCLRKGGYKAREHIVRSPTGHPAGHYVTLFEWKGNKYIMDNGRPYGRGIIPYKYYKP